MTDRRWWRDRSTAAGAALALLFFGVAGWGAVSDWSATTVALFLTMAMSTVVAVSPRCPSRRNGR